MRNLSKYLAVALILMMLGCSGSSEVDKIKKAKASDKEALIMTHVENFLGHAKFEVTSYTLDKSYGYESAEIVLQESNGGRKMLIEIRWSTR